MATKPSVFTAGRYYGGKLPGDKGAFQFKVVSRTPKILSLFGKGYTKKDGNRMTVRQFHISRDYRGVEYVWPFGKDGISPCLTAEMINKGK